MYANHKSLRYDISRVLDPIYYMSPGSRVPPKVPGLKSQFSDVPFLFPTPLPNVKA